MKRRPPGDLNKQALFIMWAILVFGTVVYWLLGRPYRGELWVITVFWLAFIISASAVAFNLKLGWALIAHRKHVHKHRPAIIFFFVSLAIVFALNYIYVVRN